MTHCAFSIAKLSYLLLRVEILSEMHEDYLVTQTRASYFVRVKTKVESLCLLHNSSLISAELISQRY
jgi:hypothetical protein